VNFSAFDDIKADKVGMVYMNVESDIRAGFAVAERHGTYPTMALYETGFIRNNELQFYRDELANAHVEDGALVITAIQERYTSGGVARDYTSARLKTQGTFEQQVGGQEDHQAVGLRYQMTDLFTVEATVGTRESGVDLFWEYTY